MEIGRRCCSDIQLSRDSTRTDRANSVAQAAQPLDINVPFPFFCWFHIKSSSEGDDYTESNHASNRDQAVAKALEYAKTHGLGEDLEIQRVFYRESLVDDQQRQLEAQLGRPIDEDERRLFQIHNKSGWVVQLVFQACANGETPQGPATLVDDDGQVSDYRPM